jgi:hypothetical protein
MVGFDVVGEIVVGSRRGGGLFTAVADSKHI